MKIDLTTQTDEELMELYKHSDDAAFDILFQRHSGRVMAYLTKRLSQKKMAEDLTQEVFLKLHRSKHLFDKNRLFLPWMFTITKNVLNDFFKKKNLEDLVEEDFFDKKSSINFELEKTNPQLEVKDILNKLPESQKQAINLRIYDEKSFEEIAQTLSTSPENVRQLFSRGIKKLKLILDKKGVKYE